MTQEVAWRPQPGPQELMLSCPYEEVLYGGAAGGGKTDALLGDFAAGIERYGSAWQGVLFRRTYPMLEEIERRSLEIFGFAYGDKCYSIGNKEWRFPNKARLTFRFLNEDKDVLSYQGKQYTWIGWDELTQWPTEYCYNYLLSRLRSPKGAPCYIRAATNPGGPGHLWVYERFVKPHPRGMTPIVETRGDGRTTTRIFIPAKVHDNQVLVRNDPGYIYRLEQLSDINLRRALLDGCWDVFAGQAFPEWIPDVHIMDDRAVPEGVTMWRAMDWGYEKPYCCLWAYADYDGNIVVCNEIYGKGAEEGKGSKEAASLVRERIETIERENGWWVPTGYLDPQCWAAHDNQPRIYDALGGTKLNWQPWSKGPGSRINQKQMVHDALKVVNGRSRLRIMRRCANLLRTLPSLPLDPKTPEDIDTNAEDHAYDALRGLLVRRVATAEERRRLNNMRTRHKVSRNFAVGRYGGW